MQHAILRVHDGCRSRGLTLVEQLLSSLAADSGLISYRLAVMHSGLGARESRKSFVPRRSSVWTSPGQSTSDVKVCLACSS